jgi:glycosyltransferase 2 family protein
MASKRIYIYALVAAVLAALIYVQFRTWRNFDWQKFASQTGHLHWWHIVHAVSLIYIAYVMRAFRWKIFLRPVRPNAPSIGMIAPTLIGFTGLALLGRPGELIRPFLIARREKLTFSSQLGVWAVERIFDIAAFTVLLLSAVYLAIAPRRLPHPAVFQRAGLAFGALSAGLILAAIVIHRSGEVIAKWIERRFAHLPSNIGQKISLRIRELCEGLNTIHGPASLFWLSAVSVVMWCVIAVSYKEVTLAYPDQALRIPQTQLLLLMGSSMVGSLIQLPGVGGGSQLATIAALQHIFGVPEELAASCGIMLWLVTFVSVVPLGLVLAHRERLSLRQLSEASQVAEETAVT